MGTRMLAVLVCAGMLLSFANVAFVAGDSSEPAPQIRVPTDRGGSTPRTALIEMFTGTWCPPCAAGLHGQSRVVEEFNNPNYGQPGEDVVAIEWHGGSPGSDPFIYNPIFVPRATYYNFPGYPSFILDGGGPYAGSGTTGGPSLLGTEGGYYWVVGGSFGGDKYIPYNEYNYLVQEELAEGSNLAIELEGTMVGTVGTIRATLTASDPIAMANLAVHIVVTEDKVYEDATSAEPGNVHHRVHTQVAREVLASEPLTLVNPGDVQVVDRSFDYSTWTGGQVGGGNDPRRMGVVVFVQSADTYAWFDTDYAENRFNSDVLQAAHLRYFDPEVLLVSGADESDWPDPPSGWVDDIFDRYDDLLTKKGIPHDRWDTYTPGLDTESYNHRVMPTAADLAPYSLVIWFTAYDTTTLTAADRLALEGYLGGPGSLLIFGENIAQDANANAWMPWFEANLHATGFITGNAGTTTANGIGGSPLGNGRTITFPASSPDGFDITLYPGLPNEVADFLYQGTFYVANWRATHDADSCVLYFGFNYFDASDTKGAPADDELIFGDGFDWCDAQTQPRLSLIQPNGGEVVVGGTLYDVLWEARDINILPGAVDIEFTTDSGSPTWLPIVTGLDNTGDFAWTAPTVQTTMARARITVTDSQGNTVQVASAADFTITYRQTTMQSFLSPGRYFLSLPVMTSGPPSVVLSSISGDYSGVWTYDPNDAMDPWDRYAPGRATNDLTSLDWNEGFWIDITTPTSLNLNAVVPYGGVLNLRTGWNAVSFPTDLGGYTVADLKAATGATTVETWDGGAPPHYLRTMADGDVLARGGAYWVFVPSDVAWSVPSA